MWISRIDIFLKRKTHTHTHTVRSVPRRRTSQMVTGRRASFVSEKVRRASQLSHVRRSSQMSTGTPSSPSKESRLRHRQSSEILKEKTIPIQEEEEKEDVVESPVVKEPIGNPRRSSRGSKSRSRRRRGKKKSRVASKAVKLLGASKSFVAAANKRDKSGKLLRLCNSGSSRRALLGSLRGILGKARWRTCNVSLQPGILSFKDLRLDGSHATSNHISLTEINSIEMNTVPAEPSEYVLLCSKITLRFYNPSPIDDQKKKITHTHQQVLHDQVHDAEW